jgi:hypothetical protein
MASAKGFDFICFARQIVHGFLADCRNKYRSRNIRCSFNLPAGNTLFTAEYWYNAAVAVVTSIQLGINEFILKPITNEVN